MMQPRLILTLLLFAGWAHQSGAQTNTSTTAATVYIMRSTGATAGLQAFNVFFDDTLACKINNNSYSVHSVAPGQHKFHVQVDGKEAKRKKPLIFPLEAGQSYYLSVDLTNRAAWAEIFLMEVTVNTANKMLPKLKQDTNCR